MNESWSQFARSKFDTIVLVLILGWLMHSGASEFHEVLGAILLALTGARNFPGPPPPNATAPAGAKEIK